MTNHENLLKFDNEAFMHFVRLKQTEKHQQLMSHGLLIDTDEEALTLVNLYFLKGFFVEETISKAEYELMDIIPFKHGYRAQSFVEVREVVVPRYKAGPGR